MGTPWLKNFVGLRQTDFELLKVSHPKTELTIHITTKTVQAGTLLGSLVVGPLIQAYNGPRDSNSMSRAVINGGWVGAGVGLVAGPILSLYRTSNMGQIGVYDRCYRLRFNSHQLRVDRLFAVAAAAGYAISGPAGFVLGVDIALLATGALNALLK